MQADTQTQVRARPRRWLRRLAAVALLLVVALGTLVAWSRTEHALATVVQALQRASDGRLELHGVSGTLYGPLGVQRLVVREAGSELAVEALELEWSPAALLAATLRVDRLIAKAVSLKQAGGAPADTAPPPTLRIPLRVVFSEIRIAQLTVTSGASTRAFSPLAATLTLGLTRHTLALSELGTPWARVSGTLSVGAWAPFQLEGHARLSALQAVPLDAAEVRIGGRLARINLQLAPQARWLAGDVAAVLAPFEASPLQAIRAALTDVDLAGLHPALPSTRVTLDARLFADGAQLAGPVSLTNALAGPLDAGRIPLSAASGRAWFDGARLRLEDLTLALAEAGRATGQVELGPQGYVAEFATDGLQLDRLHAALRPLRPAGRVRVTGKADGDHVEAELTEGDAALTLRARRSGERVDVEAANLRMAGGEIAARGELLLNAAREFKLDARLKNFDPGRFVVMPPARLNAALQASGALQPAWRAVLDYRITDSRFADAPLSGEGRLSVSEQQVDVQAASLTVGVNRLRASGRLGAHGDRLDLELDAAQLGQLGLKAEGALRAKGWIGGSRANPAFAIEGDGRGLRFKGVEAATLTLAARAAEGLQGRVEARVEARELRAAGRSLARLEATLQGTRRQHLLRATIDDPALAANLRVQGGLGDAAGWDGRIEALEAARPYRARLLAPVELRVRPGRLEAGAGRLALAGGALRFEQLLVANGTLQSRGHIERIALADLLAAPRAAATFRTDLVVSGAWDIRAAESLSGSVQLARDSGDVVLSGDTPLPLEISELRLDALARANVIEATLRGQGAKLGALSVDLRTTAERRTGAWQVAPEAPLSVRARFTVPSLNWLGRLLNPELRTRGSLSGHVDVDGTLNAPRLRGELDGEKLQLRYGAAGVRLRDGQMKIELAQDKVIFRRIAFRGDEGTLTASGEATLAGGRAQLDLDFEADKLAAVRRDDHQLALSGRGRVRSRDGRLALEGEFTADRGLIELRDADRPSLSSDVVIVSAEPKTESAPARLRLDVKLNLGEAFYVKGEGLDVRMEGGVRVTLEEGEIRPRATGSVRVVEGRYTAYGQQLSIERGVLLFDGPLDNPKLDILALRKNQRVVAGVAITGTALSPRTSLYSNPPVPDAQKLQYLVFGSGPGSAGDAEFGLASSSAQPRRDEFVSFGAQLASAVYVSVGQSLRNTDSFVQATLDLTERIALQGRTGAENAVTLIYTWEFD
jgi:translocation and assembly module TamB